MKKQQEEETARTSTEVTPAPPQEAATLDPQQQEMIEKLVAMQKQCNKRSFLDRPKVTVSEYLSGEIDCVSCEINPKMTSQCIASFNKPF